MSKEKQPKYPDRINYSSNIRTIALPDAEVDVYTVENNRDGAVGTTIVIPGFTEGITQDAYFADALAEHQQEVTIIGQYEREEKKLMSPNEALERQAMAVIALIEEKQLTQQPVNIVCNSMGSIVFCRAAQIAAENGYSCFIADSGAKVVFISPAGVNSDDSALKVAKRFAIDGGPSRSHLKEEDGWDIDSLTAGRILITRDPKKYMAEALLAALKKYHIDLNKLRELGISIDVITMPKDGIMGQVAIGAALETHLADGKVASWSSPYSPADANADNPFHRSSGGEHNAYMVNAAQAKRVADAVTALLTLKC